MMGLRVSAKNHRQHWCKNNEPDTCSMVVSSSGGGASAAALHAGAIISAHAAGGDASGQDAPAAALLGNRLWVDELMHRDCEVVAQLMQRAEAALEAIVFEQLLHLRHL